jgi:uncharacterized membrane protein
LVVTGDGVDSVNLTKTLRKKVGRAVIKEQGEVKKEEKKVEQKEGGKEKVEECMIQYRCPGQPVLIYDHRLFNQNSGGCSIL